MKLTIAIPTYNRSFFLDNNLKQLFKEYNNNFEIIIQDNASIDDTNKIVDKYIKLGLPINYERNLTNLGWAKNFEICFKKAKTKYMILLGDDDIIVNGGVDIILNNINEYSPDLIFMNAFSIKNYNKEYYALKNDSQLFDLDKFLCETILQFRLISSYVINTEYVNKVKEFSGNFAHLHVILESLSIGEKFMKINNKLIGTTKNNSDFDHKVNFSDVYVKEFFELFRSYLKNIVSKSLMIRIENIMLKKYLPKLILKSRFGFIKNDDLVSQNFDLIFGKNDYFKNYRYYFINNNLYSSFILSVMLFVNLLKYKK
jgi:abequosyltransferase